MTTMAPSTINTIKTKSNNSVSNQRSRPGCESCGGLWWFYGRAHDLAHFMDVHPGGRRLLQESRGIDLTALFESYHHPASKRADLRKLMHKYELTERKEMCSSCTAHYQTWTWPSAFYDTLSQRVHSELNAKSMLASLYLRIYWVAFVVLLVSFAVLQYVLWWQPVLTGRGSGTGEPVWTFAAVFQAVLLGLVSTLIAGYGHNQMHQGGSRLDFIFGVSGFDTIRWTRTHVALHHLFTNLEADTDWTDIETLSSHVPVPLRLFAMMIAHHLYLKPKSTVLSIARYITERNFGPAFQGDLPHSVKYLFPLVILVQTWVGAYLSGRITLLLLCDVVGWFWFLLIDFSNHYMEDTPRPNPIPSDWGMSQVVTSQDFYITGVGIVDCILGIGLDRQLSHHLFPKLPHCYLSLIDPVVRRTCVEFNVEPSTCPQLFTNIPHILAYRFFSHRAAHKSKERAVSKID